MNKGYRKKVWKCAGIFFIVLIMIIEFFILVYGYDALKVVQGKNIALSEQLYAYEQTEKKAEMLKDVRAVFLSEVELSVYLQAGDMVDVRIRYGNAEDYIVLSGKTLMECEMGHGIVLLLTEEEILYISSAVADCENFKNTRLYAVEYPEEVKQGGSSTNYISSMEILAMLKKETTEGERRLALEQRLAKENK